MSILIRWIISALAIVVAAYILPGVHVDGFFTALVTAVVLGILNAFIKPILIILTLPITILTLGLFTFVINALLILITSFIVPGFRVDSFWWAIAFGILLAIIHYFINLFES